MYIYTLYTYIDKPHVTSACLPFMLAIGRLIYICHPSVKCLCKFMQGIDRRIPSLNLTTEIGPWMFNLQVMVMYRWQVCVLACSLTLHHASSPCMWLSERRGCLLGRRTSRHTVRSLILVVLVMRRTPTLAITVQWPLPDELGNSHLVYVFMFDALYVNAASAQV